MENLQWNRQEPTKVTEIGRRTIVSKTFEMPDGEPRTYDTVNAEDYASVAVIALTEQNEVLTVSQYRPGPEKIMHELPGGFVDPGEDPVRAGMRELLEETGYESHEEPEYLGYCQYDAYSNGKRHVVLARNCVQSEHGQKLDVTEFVNLGKVSVGQLITYALTAQMTDPGAVLLGYDQLKAVEQRG